MSPRNLSTSIHQPGSFNLTAAFLGLTPEPHSPPRRISRTSRRSTALQLMNDEQDIKPSLPDLKPILINQSVDEPQSGDNFIVSAAGSDEEFDELKPTPTKTSLVHATESDEEIDELKPSLNKTSEDELVENPSLSNSSPVPIIPNKRRIRKIASSSDDGKEILDRVKRTKTLPSESSLEIPNATTSDQAELDYTQYPAGSRAGRTTVSTDVSEYMKSLADLAHQRKSENGVPVEDFARFISSSQPWGSPENNIELSKIRSLKDIRTYKQSLLDHFRYESKGITIDTDRLLDFFWKYEIVELNCRTPFETMKNGVIIENKRLIRAYLDYYENHSIKALPLTKLKIFLFFLDVYSHLAKSSKQNYVNSLINTCMMAKIMFPGEIDISFPLIPEILEDKIWNEFLEENHKEGIKSKEENTKNKKKSMHKPEGKRQKVKRRAKES